MRDLLKKVDFLTSQLDIQKKEVEEEVCKDLAT